MHRSSPMNFDLPSHSRQAKSILWNILEGTKVNSQANHLVFNILEISHCESRFYAGSEESPATKYSRINNLEIDKKKECGPTTFGSSDKSLFWNILLVSPYSSRFYRDTTPSRSSKLLRINILEKGSKKKSKDHNQIRSCFAILQYKSIDSDSSFFSMYSPSVCAT